MIGELMRIADEIEPGIRDFFRRSWFNRSIRGVSLDVDDYWEFAELTRESGLHSYSCSGRFGDLEDLAGHRLSFQIQSLSRNFPPWMDFRPDWWSDHCRWMHYPDNANPVIIRVLLKQAEKITATDLPRNFENYPIVYEFRPPNRAVGSIGTIDWLARVFGLGRSSTRAPSIGRASPNTAGTLGGILGGGDPRTRYLVTCAHVLGPAGTDVYEPGPFEGKSSQRIGLVKHWSMPPLRVADDPCSAEAAPSASRVDMAVAELAIDEDSLARVGTVTRVNNIRPITAIRKNDRVTFTGKTKGRVDARIGALTLWDQIEFPDGVRCFGRIFEIKLPTREYVRQDLAHPGDSGSWVVFQVGDVVAWYGMVISCDGGQAYGCFAQYILDECNTSGAFPGGIELLV